jgi:23S rRNA (guanine745-N1)-methyltransferase
MEKPLSSKPVLRCPACAEALEWGEKECRCANGHTFDLAKEGYANLLLSHQRRSNHPGDDDNMIQARRRFFDSGVFDPLTNLILNSSFITHHSQTPKPTHSITHPTLSLLDCGCGEGHSLGTLSESLSGQFFGVDVSKEAVRCAAKRYKKAKWIVANGMRTLPFADRSLDVILSVLAPRNPEEFARILKPDGALILGVPGPNHLIELRSRLSTNAADFEEKADEAAAKCAPYFTETNRELLSYEQTLNATQIADLIQMTPIFWCSSPEAKASVQQFDHLTVTISFVLITLQRPA